MNIVLVIITWLGLVAPAMNKLPMPDWQTCDDLMMRLNVIYETARKENPEFGFSLKCERNEQQ